MLLLDASDEWESIFCCCACIKPPLCEASTSSGCSLHGLPPLLCTRTLDYHVLCIQKYNVHGCVQHAACCSPISSWLKWTIALSLQVMLITGSDHVLLHKVGHSDTCLLCFHVQHISALPRYFTACNTNKSQHAKIASSEGRADGFMAWGVMLVALMPLQLHSSQPPGQCMPCPCRTVLQHCSVIPAQCVFAASFACHQLSAHHFQCLLQQ